MKIFADIDQNSRSQSNVAGIKTPANKAYYNEGNLVAATQSATGLLTAADKTKLNGIAAGANKTVVDTALSSSSTNPVQNKIVTTALAGKADASHDHTYTDCIIRGGGENGRLRSLGARAQTVFGNVFHGLPASAIVVERSTDSGATWTADAYATDSRKRLALSGTDSMFASLYAGADVGTAYQFRVTIDAAADGFYGVMDRIYMNINTQGTVGCWCSVYTRPADTETFTLRGTYNISGWTGWNSVPFYYTVAGAATAAADRVRYVRLVFGGNHTDANHQGLFLLQLYGTAVQKYAAANTMVAAGVPYAVDPDLLTSFSAGVSVSTIVSRTYNSSVYFLMGNGSVTTKKDLTSVSHCGWTSRAVDSLLVPTMNTIAYWNGAYNSAGSSNLAYCSKGAFGTFAAKSSLAFSELTSKPTTLSGYGITDALPLTGGTLTGALTVQSTITATGTIYSSTGIYTAGYVSARGQDTSSDIALKRDFSPVGNALEYVKGTRYTRFKWKDGGGESIGVIAQEEEKREYGFLVRRHAGVGHLTYDYAASTALLGAALQEEDRKVEELKTRITELENEIKNLKLCR